MLSLDITSEKRAKKEDHHSLYLLQVSASQTNIFAVAGMTCGSCAGRVESALLKRAEVTEAKVDLAGAKVKVSYAPGTDVDSLFEAVRGIGYEMAALPQDIPPAPRGLFGRLRRRRGS